MQHAHLLIVEDDPIANAMLEAWAQHLGSTVTTTRTIDEADAALANGTFDLILSDVHLPGNHRLEWIERVLAADFPPPIILLTGNPELESTLRAANLPVAGYLVKPPDFKALGQQVQRLVSDHRRRREFRSLSREAAWLLTQPEASSAPAGDALREKLLQLSRHLAAEAGRSPRAAVPAGGDDAWHSAITETIAVLEKTKGSFRSKELGALRRRLQQVLRTGSAPRPPA